MTDRLAFPSLPHKPGTATCTYPTQIQENFETFPPSQQSYWPNGRESEEWITSRSNFFWACASGMNRDQLVISEPFVAHTSNRLISWTPPVRKNKQDSPRAHVAATCAATAGVSAGTVASTPNGSPGRHLTRYISLQNRVHRSITMTDATERWVELISGVFSEFRSLGVVRAPPVPFLCNSGDWTLVATPR